MKSTRDDAGPGRSPLLPVVALLGGALGLLGYTFSFATVGWRVPIARGSRIPFELGLLAQYLAIGLASTAFVAAVCRAVDRLRGRPTAPERLVGAAAALAVWAAVALPLELLWLYRNRPLSGAGARLWIGSLGIALAAVLPALLMRAGVLRLARPWGPRPARLLFAAAALVAVVAGSVVSRAVLNPLPPRRAPAASAFPGAPQIDRVVILGLDGATWKLASPLIERGELPNLARLAREGASGPLTSIEPIESPRVWTSVATGKLSEKHGIQDYISDSRFIRTATLWEILSRHGRRVGLFDYLVTHPPPELDGFVLPGWDASGRAANRPPGLRRELDVVRALRHPFRTARIALQRYPVLLNPRTSSVDKLVARTFQDTEGKELDLPYLVEAYSPDVLVVLYFGTDIFGHMLWQYMEPAGFPDVGREQRERYGPLILEAYRIADRAVGSLLRHYDDRTLVVVLSDHGFRRADDLIRLTYLNDGPLLSALGLSTVVTVVGRGPDFLALAPKDASPAREILDAVARTFESMSDVGTGARVFDVDRVSAERPYVRIRLRSNGAGSAPKMVRAGDTTIALGDLLMPVTLSGTHALDGLLILHGPGVSRGTRIDGASVIDIAPTVLYALGLPVGDDMDGKVLTSALERAWTERVPIARVDTHDTGLTRQIPAQPADPTAELVERLRSLGYMK